VIPNGDERSILLENFKSKSYDLDGGIIIDGRDAVKQSVFLTLNTPRYGCAIYSWNYGGQLENFIGKSLSIVYAMVQTNIKEAIMMDDRILNVNGFSFKKDKGFVTVFFTVTSIYGQFESEVNVNV